MSSGQSQTPAAGARQEKVLPFFIGGRLYALPVRDIRDVVLPQPLTRIHPGSPEIAGLLNLNGRIVTALDIRVRLGLKPLAEGSRAYGILIERAGLDYILLVDRVCSAMALAASEREPSLEIVDPRLREVAAAAYRTKEGPLVVIDLDRLFRSMFKKGVARRARP
jgi:purine-binding chemotaxis protein CheW